MNDDVDFNSERPWKRLSNAGLVELWRDSVNHAACDFDFCFDELRSVYEEAMTRGLLELPSWTAIVRGRVRTRVAGAHRQAGRRGDQHACFR